MPESLSPLPLYYLRLHLPRMPHRYILWDHTTGEDVHDAAGQPIYNATEQCAYGLYGARDATLKTLPEWCARAIPTLKFFVPYTLSSGETTPPFSFGNIEHVPIVSTSTAITFSTVREEGEN